MVSEVGKWQIGRISSAVSLQCPPPAPPLPGLGDAKYFHHKRTGDQKVKLGKAATSENRAIQGADEMSLGCPRCGSPVLSTTSRIPMTSQTPKCACSISKNGLGATYYIVGRRCSSLSATLQNFITKSL